MDHIAAIERLIAQSKVKTSQKPGPAKKPASRREAEEAVTTYKDLTSGRGFAGLSPAQIAKKLAAIEKLRKPEPIVFRPSYLLEKFPKSAGPFFDALDRLYTLPRMIRNGHIINKTSANPKDWAVLDQPHTFNDSGLLSSPNIRVQPKGGLPGIEIQMCPIDNETGQRIFNGNEYRPAPIYVQDIQTWKESQDIQNHQIKGWAGAASESEEVFNEPKALRDVISGLNDGGGLGITDETTVVHLKTVLPIDSQNTFTAEFLPKIWHPKSFEPGSKINRNISYKLTVIEGDRINKYEQLMERESGREVHRTVPDEKDPLRTKHYSWKPNYVPDMGALQKQLINDSKSRMIIIATPYELEQQQQVEPFSYGDYDDSSSYIKFSKMPASIGQVRFSQGSSAGEGSIIDEELQISKEQSVIFAIDCLGIKPEDAGQLKQSLT